MSPSSFEKAIRLQFDCLIRKVIDRAVKNYYRELGRHAKHEVPFCDVTEADLNHVATIDEYSIGYTVFPVYGTEVRVFDPVTVNQGTRHTLRQLTAYLLPTPDP